MGDSIWKYYKTKISQEAKNTFFWTFFAALLIHLYKFTNTLPNHDSLYNYYSDQSNIGSGRWALSFACGMSSYYDLPWMNGLMSCLFIALTAAVIVVLFKVKNPILCGLIGVMIASAPAITETMFFLFTADGYMMAMFLAAMAVYFSRVEEKRLSRQLLSGACICISCAIYQAYVSFALLLAVSYFVDILLSNCHTRQDCLKWVLRQIIIYVVSLAVYYVIWKICLKLTGTVVNDYQGISEVGKVSFSLLVTGIIGSIKALITYFFQWNVMEHGFTFYSVLSIIFLFFMAAGLVIAVFKSGIFKRKWAMLLLMLCLLAIVPFACMWNFVSDSVIYRPMMLQSLCMLFVLTAVLYERWAKPVLKNLIALLLIVIVFHNAVMANISYYYMNLCYERTYAEGMKMNDIIRDYQEEYQVEKIAIVGNRIEEVQWTFADQQTGEIAPAGRIFMLSAVLETSLLIGTDPTLSFLSATFGMELEPVSTSRLAELQELPEVKSMDCFPSKGAFAVIGDTLVIKLSEA